MSADESEDEKLKTRVASLESELRALRARIAALEMAPWNSAVRAEPAAPPVPPAPEEPVKTPPALATPAEDRESRRAGPPPLPKPDVAAGRQRFRAGASRSVAAAAPTPAVPGRRELPLRPPPVPQGPSPFVKFLHAVHLLPPAGGESGEVQLGAWWATRIGALLVVLAVVFFGVYVSIGTPPWVKLAELAAVSAGVALTGRWLEHRIGRFGSVILGGGLALVFFTAFAAYAIPAVKVTDSLLVAAGLQAAAVLFVFGVSVARGSKTVATMATLLGFASAFFSIAEGFDDFAVFGALALAGAGVGLRRWKGWAPPVLFAVVLTYAILAVVSVSIWDTEVGRRSPPYVFGIAGAAFVLFFLSVAMEGPDQAGRFSRAQRWLQALNGSLGAIAGLVAATSVLSSGDLSWYFFAAGAVLLLASAWAWRVAPDDPLMSAFAVKASALIALGVMTEWEARTRWLALLLEAFVLFAASRRTGKRILAIVAAAVWAFSLFFRLSEPPVGAGQWISAGGLSVALYAVASPALLGLVARMLSTSETSAGAAVVVGFVASVPAWRACGSVYDEAWAPLAMIGVVCCLAGTGRLLRSIVPVVGSVLVLGWAFAALQMYSVWRHGAAWLWTCAFAVAIVSATGAWWAVERGPGGKGQPGRGIRIAGGLLAVLAVTALAAGAFKFWPSRAGLAVSVGLAVALTWHGAAGARREWQWSGVVAGFASLALFATHAPGPEDSAGGLAWLWVAALGGALALVGSRRAGAPETDGSASEGWLPWLAALLSVILLWMATYEGFEVVGRGWVSVAAMVGYAMAARGLRMQAAWGAASLFPGIAFLAIVTAPVWPPGDIAWAALGSAWVAGVVFAALPAVAVRMVDWIPSSLVRGWCVLHLVVASLFLLSVTLARPAPWASLTTVIWALAGIAWFLVGLFCQARSHRVGGLLVLALCIPRAFFIDINSTLYRIAAFVVLGLVLLWVGFSYQRFRHLVQDDTAGNNEKRPDEGA